MNEWLTRIRMIMCCFILSFSIVITILMFLNKLGPMGITSIAIDWSVLLIFYKPELKILWNKIKGNFDDFNGGNFT